MLDIKPKEMPKNKKVMMLWTEDLFVEAKKYAEKHGISVSELSRLAIQNVLDSDKGEA